MEYPIAELFDRCSIELLKEERIPNYKSQFRLDADSKMAEYNCYPFAGLFAQLVYWNGLIWDLESDIRKGKENELGLEEVGRRALMIRDYNNNRVKVKNEIAEIVNQYKEVKFNHASQ